MNPKKLSPVEMTVAALLIALFFWWLLPVETSKKPDAGAAKTPAEKTFPEVSLEAKSAYVLDAKTGKALYEKDSELQWPLASLTKLMVALTASKIIPDYMLVRITFDDVSEEGDTGLFVGEEWNVRKLTDFSLVVSSNDGIKAIASVAGSQIATSTVSTSSAESLFVGRMNQTAKDIGLTETYFLNQSGLDMSSTLSGGYGSARDVASLVAYIIKNNPHMLEATSLPKSELSSLIKTHEAVNTNKSVQKIPNVLASKTGYTSLSGGNVVVAVNAGLDHPIIISILGSSYDGRFKDLNTLVKATIEYFAP